MIYHRACKLQRFIATLPVQDLRDYGNIVQRLGMISIFMPMEHLLRCHRSIIPTKNKTTLL